MSRVFLLLFVTFQGYAAAPEGVRFDHVTAGESTYQIADVDLKHADLKLYWKNAKGQPYESLADLRGSLKVAGKSVLMATNAGIYAADFTPLGLHIERGTQIHALNRSHASTGNFFMKPNGVFAITDKGAQVFETNEFAAYKKPVLEASQSGPLLLHRGKPNPTFHEDSGNKKLRSGVGVNEEGHAIFAVSEGAVGFYEFAIFFRDTMHCQNALYLDGTISTMIEGEKTAPTQLVAYTGIWAATAK